MPSERGGWPDQVTHYATINGIRNGWFIPPNYNNYPIIGHGGESVTFRVSALNILRQSTPVVLKSYSVIPFEWEGQYVINDSIAIPLDTARRLVDRQMEGFGLLDRANKILRQKGKNGFNLPEIV